ncbi:MAG: hypothetical protein Q9166_002218 [cf. Caloplaca sp. 2 TL-2023]
MNAHSIQQPKEAKDSFPFLSLPLELRRHVYTEVVVPSVSPGSVANPCTLWHDRHGPQRHRFVYPELLLVNKQINTEATPVLYENITFKINISTPVIPQCTGGAYPDRKKSPRYLFRSDRDHSPPRYFNADESGFIYPHCLQRIASIEIRVSADAIWGSSKLGDYFSHIGSLFCKILRLLAESEPDEISAHGLKFKKRLLLTVHKDYFSNSRKVLFPRQQKEGRQRTVSIQKGLIDEIPRLVEVIARKREVKVRETTVTKRRKVDLKDFRNL